MLDSACRPIAHRMTSQSTSPNQLAMRSCQARLRMIKFHQGAWAWAYAETALTLFPTTTREARSYSAVHVGSSTASECQL